MLAGEIEPVQERKVRKFATLRVSAGDLPQALLVMNIHEYTSSTCSFSTRVPCIPLHHRWVSDFTVWMRRQLPNRFLKCLVEWYCKLDAIIPPHEFFLIISISGNSALPPLLSRLWPFVGPSQEHNLLNEGAISQHSAGLPRALTPQKESSWKAKRPSF